ncbi:cutinase [Colletotrichum abscissum]|uniref:Cutinase n=1 Tax=Colletotrichum limetticola TaxID=1209924 RepID=A0ABQ9PT06_9PEZI|nr:cutinase [Colletotrichum abscissum]KAK0374664.1 cutinase [Colletotrichum limetticola]KAK1508895.1 cutinase [Colletotrichum abscissum]KAK1706689.1 cutinase [Colletotrichum lupini]
MVYSPVVALGFLGALQGRSEVYSRQTNATGCATGVHMIVARASTEQPGTGVIGAIANSIQSQIPGSDIVPVDYPALLNPYQPSQKAGVTAMTKLVQDYAKACPQTKMVLMGYSQGAHVTADVLCGTSETGFASTEPQATDVTDKIAAVVLMGDPSHVTGQPFDQGTSQKNGIFPRTKTAGCDAVSSKMASFCNSGDPFCDSGANIQVHLSYVQSDGDAATKFIMSKVGGGAAA